MGSILALIGGFGLLVVINVAIKVLLHLGKSTVTSAARTVTGKGSFTSNFKATTFGMPPFQTRLIDGPLDNTPNSPTVKYVEAMGLFPIVGRKKIGYVTSVIDVTATVGESVICILDGFQEKESVAFQFFRNGGEVQEGYGFPDWVRIGMVPTDILQPPYGGKRKLGAILRIIDLETPPPIHGGFHNGKPPGLLWFCASEFEFNFSEKGYLEAAKDREESQGLSIKIAMAVAAANGPIDDSAAEVLRKWIIKAVDSTAANKRERMKNIYNDAFMNSFNDALAGKLDLCPLTSRLNDIGEKRIKYEALELCYDIMTAKGTIGEKEMRAIAIVAEGLNLDINEIQKMKDQKLLNVDLSSSTQAEPTNLLGIQPDWTPEQTRRHLRDEFQKWNNRVSALPEGKERDNAQRMLEIIAEARKKSA